MRMGEWGRWKMEILLLFVAGREKKVPWDDGNFACRMVNEVKRPKRRSWVNKTDKRERTVNPHTENAFREFLSSYKLSDCVHRSIRPPTHSRIDCLPCMYVEGRIEDEEKSINKIVIKLTRVLKVNNVDDDEFHVNNDFGRSRKRCRSKRAKKNLPKERKTLRIRIVKQNSGEWMEHENGKYIYMYIFKVKQRSKNRAREELNSDTCTLRTHEAKQNNKMLESWSSINNKLVSSDGNKSIYIMETQTCIVYEKKKMKITSSQHTNFEMWTIKTICDLIQSTYFKI